jgi:hypothetical protein
MPDMKIENVAAFAHVLGIHPSGEWQMVADTITKHFQGCLVQIGQFGVFVHIRFLAPAYLPADDDEKPADGQHVVA